MQTYANNAASTLSAAISTATRPVSFDLADASAFPATGNFNVIIDDEILLVTTIVGNTLTGSNVEGTTAATHASAAAVTQILTRAGLLASPGPMTTAGDMFFAGASVVPTRLAAVATGNVLLSGGVATAPAWGKVDVTAAISGILPTANGGTGLAYFTAAGPTAARVFTFPDAAATIARTDAGQTFTGAQSITGPVGSSALSIAGGTQASSFPALSITQTWNNAGTTFTAVLVNVTNTASASGSKVFDLQVGGSSVFNVNKSADVVINGSGGTLNLNGNVTAGGFVCTGGTGVQLNASSSRLQSFTDGNIRLCNNASSDFGLLTFGGTSSSFPALKRSSAVLQARLADDSDYATLQGKYNSSDGTAGATAGPFTTITSITVKNGIVTALTGA